MNTTAKEKLNPKGTKYEELDEVNSFVSLREWVKKWL